MNGSTKRRSLQAALVLSALVTLAVAASCGGGGGGGDGAGSHPLGGTIVATVNGGFGRVRAVFYASAGTLTDADPLAYVPMGGCATPAPASTAGTFTYLSVGTSMSVRNGTTTNVMPETRAGPFISYQTPGGASLPEGSWDVLLAGSGAIAAQTWTGALRVPTIPTVTAPAGFGGAPLHIATSGALVLTWTSGATPATAMAVQFHNGPGGGGGGGGGNPPVLVCRGPGGGGSLTVPATSVALLGTTGQITVTRYDFGIHDLQSRSVTLAGESTVRANFRKP